jgi:hypothetical protein
MSTWCEKHGWRHTDGGTCYVCRLERRINKIEVETNQKLNISLANELNKRIEALENAGHYHLKSDDEPEVKEEKESELEKYLDNLADESDGNFSPRNVANEIRLLAISRVNEIDSKIVHCDRNDLIRSIKKALGEL